MGRQLDRLRDAGAQAAQILKDDQYKQGFRSLNKRTKRVKLPENAESSMLAAARGLGRDD